MSGDQPRLLVIGLDGGSWNVLEPLLERGLMPCLQRLMREGSYGILQSCVPAISPPAWATFQTGKNPGQHGVLHFFDLRASGRDGRVCFEDAPIVNQESIETATIFDIMAHAGRPIGSVNVPLTYPPPVTQGAVVSDWLTPVGAEEFTFPPELAKELPGYRIDQDFGQGRFGVLPRGVELDSQTLLSDLTDLVRRRTEAAQYLLTRKPWQCFMVCFTEPDRVQHHLWRAVDRMDARHTMAGVAREREGVSTLFGELDRSLQLLIDSAGAGCNVFVISDHGFQSPPSRRALPNEWLIEHGWLILRPEYRRYRSYQRMAEHPWVRWIRQAVSQTARSTIRGAGLRGLGSIDRLFQQRCWEWVDWPKSLAWAVTLYRNWGAIFLTSEGQRRGRWVRSKLLKQLKRWRDPETGTPVCHRAFERETLYQGPAVARMPEILFELSEPYEAGKEGTFLLDTYTLGRSVAAEAPYPCGRGSHAPDGIYITWGPGFSPLGRARRYQLLDVLPTMLALLDIPIPQDLEGEVMAELLTLAFRGAYPVASQGPVTKRQRLPGGATDDAKDALLRERLRALGYIE